TFTIGGGAGQVALPGAGLTDPAGNYYLLAVADPTDAIFETDTDPFNEDNTAVFAGAYHVAGGQVLAHDTTANDNITLTTGSTLTLTLNGTPQSYTAGDVAAFVVRGNAGNNLLTVNDSSYATACT